MISGQPVGSIKMSLSVSSHGTSLIESMLSTLTAISAISCANRIVIIGILNCLNNFRVSSAFSAAGSKHSVRIVVRMRSSLSLERSACSFHVSVHDFCSPGCTIFLK